MFINTGRERERECVNTREKERDKRFIQWENDPINYGLTKARLPYRSKESLHNWYTFKNIVSKKHISRVTVDTYL